MQRRFHLIFALTAWLLATGSHWDLVQTFGWGRMIATYSQTMPLSAAIRLTFTPENMCGVCTAVSEAKQTSDAHAIPGGKLDGKVILLAAPSTVLVLETRFTPERVVCDAVSYACRPAEPAVPPPRVLVA